MWWYFNRKCWFAWKEQDKSLWWLWKHIKTIGCYLSCYINPIKKGKKCTCYITPIKKGKKYTCYITGIGFEDTNCEWPKYPEL